jgi:parallel beta-helix repeat protein
MIGGVGLISVLITPALGESVKLLSPPRTFPLIISAPGSYRLKKNFTVPDANTTAIEITAANVTLDLNGYAISGPTACTGFPVTSCAPAGGGKGIYSLAMNVRVTGGTVQGMGDHGIQLLGSGSTVDNIRGNNNGGSAVEMADGGRLTDNVASANGAGLGCGNWCYVSGNAATFNMAEGLYIGSESTILDNVASRNGGTGIASGDHSTIANNTANSNGGDGISGGGVVTHNSVSQNGSTGIEAGAFALVTGNSAAENVFEGLSAASETVYGNNAFNSVGFSSEPTSAAATLRARERRDDATAL